MRRAHDEADLIVSGAESRRDDLVSDSEGRLAALETSLQATLEAVTRGRSRLRGRNLLDELGPDSFDGAGDD